MFGAGVPLESVYTIRFSLLEEREGLAVTAVAERPDIVTDGLWSIMRTIAMDVTAGFNDFDNFTIESAIGLPMPLGEFLNEMLPAECRLWVSEAARLDD